jgi:phosphate starvation-inducible PhoH-like protein
MLNSMDECTQSKQTRLTFSDIELARQLFGEQDWAPQTSWRIYWPLMFMPGATPCISKVKIWPWIFRGGCWSNSTGCLRKNTLSIPMDIDYALRILKENHTADLKEDLS